MNSDKQSGDTQQQSSNNKSNKPELTAEWTVHAQLTISRPGGDSSKPFESDDRSNPLRVVYKWSSDNIKPGEEQQTTKTGTYHQRGPSESPLKGHDSFHSTLGGKLPSDSGLSSSNTSRKQAPYGGARCKSTCSIVLSAVADFLPTTADIPEEPDPFYFNTTASYTLSPDQAGDETKASQNFGTSKILALRDAFSQTSDTETKKPQQYNVFTSPKSSNDSRDGRKRMPYDYRRLTESMLPPPVDEGDSYLPSYTKSSPARTYTQSPLPSSVSQHQSTATQKSETKKPPRTVHIDVYCTGSDGEDDDDDDDSSQTSSENHNELESNSTPQTVLDTEQMLLRHQRAGKAELPRRFMTQQQKAQVQETHQPNMQNIGHALTQSNTADEISESKQMLFKKHIGDQRSKFNYRNRFYRRDQSDDGLSSNYPNSSRSTVRDMTCSSISSAVASALYEDVESSWKETEPEYTATSLAKSDSFEYDNSIDRYRIQTMERLWSQPEKDDPDYMEYSKPHPHFDPHYRPTSQQKRIKDFLQSYRLPAGTRRHHYDSVLSEYDNLSETDHTFPIDRSTIPERDEPIEPEPIPVHSHRLLIDPMRSGRGGSETRSPERHNKVLFTADYNKSGSEASTMQSNLSGYTSDYLLKARKFGAVVTALRKPGHHVGPAKNPECQCEHCRRWMAERTEGRGRALSMGDTPFTRSSFWLRRTTPL